MPRSYTNIIDYARTQLDTFAQREVCRVDSLVFSWLSYFRLPEAAFAAFDGDGMPLKELHRAEWFEEMCGRLNDSASSIELLGAVAASPRFRDVRVSGYVSKTNQHAEQQFSAMTFHISPRETYVAFRGTDNTIVGWKEDFNMAFSSVVPSQQAAARYLEHAASRTSGRLWCGGHSKGGNLAVYACMSCSDAVAERIVRCYSHDGPGFLQETMNGAQWRERASLVDKTIPQSSVIGMLLENQEHDYSVVHSHAVGFGQHDPFSWEVDLRDFALDERVGVGASALDSSLDAWLASTSPAERARFVDAVFTVLGAAGFSTMGDIRRGWRTSVPKMLVAAAELPAEDRQLVMTAAGDIVRSLAPRKQSAGPLTRIDH